METDIFKIVDSESLEVGNDKVYKLVNITIEDMTDKVGNSTESLYRSIEGALVQLNSTNEEGKIYKVTEGTSDDIYGKVEQIYKVYKVVDEDEKYMIVGSTETNPDDFKISDESPLGSALMGKKAGNIAEVHAPIGIILYEIVKIES
ncbi:MAG: GreA/GreB family elongation factor [Selenomonadaceae bacterium]|nr:GreA/GreB family elongation factor [Selenomonadaceae bacterium]